LAQYVFSIFTADLPETEQALTATYVDETAILVSHQNHITASRILQNYLNRLEQWLKLWRIKANENKLTQVTFSETRR
jgi:broad specificity phosphatase PhoE